MTKTAAVAMTLAAIGLAACTPPNTPSRIGGESTAPNAAAAGTGGGVGAGENTTHPNGPASEGGANTGGGSPDTGATSTQ